MWPLKQGKFCAPCSHKGSRNPLSSLADAFLSHQLWLLHTGTKWTREQKKGESCRTVARGLLSKNTVLIRVGWRQQEAREQGKAGNRRPRRGFTVLTCVKVDLLIVLIGFLRLCHSATGQKKRGNPKEREFAWSPCTSFQVSRFAFFLFELESMGSLSACRSTSCWPPISEDCSHFGSSQVRPPAVLKVFQATTLSSVARCRPQSRLGWTLTPLTSPRWLCTMLAAAATTVVCLKCTTLDVQHRKPSFALSATFAARLAHLACAVDAVPSDVSTSRHAAKHRASSSAAWRDPHSHPMMKCLACWTYASSIASPDLDAAWGWVTWRPSKCHGSLKLPPPLIRSRKALPI